MCDSIKNILRQEVDSDNISDNIIVRQAKKWGDIYK